MRSATSGLCGLLAALLLPLALVAVLAAAVLGLPVRAARTLRRTVAG